MNKMITTILTVLAILVLLPMMAWAQETTLTTSVPSCHVLHVELIGNGEVAIDNISCKQSGDLQIKRHTRPQLSVISAHDTRLRSAVLNGEDITKSITEGIYTMPELCFDSTLTVEFETIPTTPQTDDSFPLMPALCMLVCSSVGLLVLGIFRKRIK